MSIDAKLGHVIWDALHAIAINMPDEGAGLTKERFKGYYDFFNSLRYVLPRDEWREKWAAVTSSGNATKLDMNTFTQRILGPSNHKRVAHVSLSKWLFDVHHDISKLLKKRGKDGRNGYKAWYAKYAVFRKFGKGGGSPGVPEDKAGIEKIMSIITRKGLTRAMDEALISNIGNKYRRWTVARKVATRKARLSEIGRYFWAKYYAEEAESKNFDAMDIDRKRKAVVSAFEYGTRSMGRVLVNRVTNAPHKFAEFIGMR